MIRRLARSPWLPFWLACAGVTLFYLCCTRLLVKTDDGHFLGILRDPAFAPGAWLRARYQTVSGRTISEALMMTFLRAPLVCWKLASAALLCAVMWFFCKVAVAFSGRAPAREPIAFACACVLLALPTCMGAGAFWFAGSFTYLWPAAALVICVMPLVFGALEVPFPPWLYALSFLAAPVAASQEQAAAATVALLLCLNAILLLRKRWRVWAALPLAPAVACAYFLLTAPGARLRSAAEAAGGFPAFAALSAPEKLLCGLSNYAAYALFLSLPAMAVFLLTLYQSLRACRRAALIHGLCALLLCLGGNAACLAARRRVPDQLFERMFLSGRYDAFALALIAASALFFLSVLVLLVLLARRRGAAGLGAGLCFAAAVCCGVVPGFSGSVFASGQRIFFFSDLFLLLAAVILSGGAEDTKAANRVRRGACLLAGGFAVFYVLGFKVLEIPPMG